MEQTQQENNQESPTIDINLNEQQNDSPEQQQNGNHDKNLTNGDQQPWISEVELTHEKSSQSSASASPYKVQQNAIKIQRVVSVDPSSRTYKRPIFVGIAGGTASGKTTVCEEVFKRVSVQYGQEDSCCLIPFDCFYKECSPEQMANIGSVNFDHPAIFDWDLVRETLTKLQNGEDVLIPDYDYTTCKRKPPGKLLKWSPLILYEGIFALLDTEINEKFLDFKIFVHTDDDIRLSRRLMRDIVERGRKVEGILKSYHRFVKPAHVEFVKPTMKYADLILPWGRKFKSGKNQIAINFITQNLEHMLLKRGFVIENLPDKGQPWQKQSNSEIFPTEQCIQGAQLPRLNAPQTQEVQHKLKDLLNVLTLAPRESLKQIIQKELCEELLCIIQNSLQTIYKDKYQWSTKFIEFPQQRIQPQKNQEVDDILLDQAPADVKCFFIPALTNKYQIDQIIESASHKTVHLCCLYANSEIYNAINQEKDGKIECVHVLFYTNGDQKTDMHSFWTMSQQIEVTWTKTFFNLAQFNFLK